MKEPPWALPQARFMGHPDVPVFLRANEKITFQKFSSIVEARDFATKLKRNSPKDRFSVRVSAVGSAHNSRVIISKNRK